MTRLEDLIRGAILRGILPGSQVTVVDARWYGVAAVELQSRRTPTAAMEQGSMSQKHSKSQQRRLEDKARRRKHRHVHQMSPARPGRADGETDLLMKAFDDMQARGELAGMPTVFNPPGQEKMSEILEEFVEPYLQYTENVQQVKKLMLIASVAWNAALMEGDKREDFLQGMLESLPPDGRDDSLALIDGMIKHKLKYFAAYRRLVVSVQVFDTGDGFHVAVASFETGPND